MPKHDRAVPLSLLVGALCVVPAWAGFNHPGILHSRADLERMRDMVAQGVEPVRSGFDVFRGDPSSQLGYRMRGPGEEIGRNPGVNAAQFDSDANASYQLALMWAITGEGAYASKAIAIIDAWSASLRRVSGRDAVLMAGLGPFKMINAGEILRHTDAVWSNAGIRRCERMLLDVIYPAIQDFAPFANGNWDGAAMQTVMAIGVFCDDRTIFERALCYYAGGAGNGRLSHYIVSETGQCQESGRDQQHTQLGLGLLADCCEVAWQQGLDLYAYDDNRLLKGFEYTAKYNLGEEVPFARTLDRTGHSPHEAISSQGRGRLRAVYEMVYHHNAHRAGLAAPYTQRAAERIRPEGPGRPSADHPGFGTLLFSRTAARGAIVAAPAAPGGVLGHGTCEQIELTWIAAVDGTRYTVKRAVEPEGPFETIADAVPVSRYVDEDVQPGRVYYYTVSAANSAGGGPDAYPAAVCAGLPEGWSQVDVGGVAVPGSSGFDGTTFAIEAAGNDIGARSDQLHFAYASMAGDGVITARYQPQLNSQFTKFGLMMRESLEPSAAHASVWIVPRFGRNVTAPGWYVLPAGRATAGGDTVAGDGVQLDAPCVSYGRLVGPCWLRLERKGDVFLASVSADGRTWTPAGETTLSLKRDLLVGPGACSCLTTVTTRVRFDHVSVSARVVGDTSASPHR